MSTQSERKNETGMPTRLADLPSPSERRSLNCEKRSRSPPKRVSVGVRRVHRVPDLNGRQSYRRVSKIPLIHSSIYQRLDLVRTGFWLYHRRDEIGPTVEPITNLSIRWSATKLDNKK